MQRHQQAGPSLENLHWDESAHLTNLNRLLQLVFLQIAQEVLWQDTIKVVPPQIAYLLTQLAKTWLRLKRNLTSLDSKWSADLSTLSCISRINKSNSSRWEARVRRPSTRVWSRIAAIISTRLLLIYRHISSSIVARTTWGMEVVAHKRSLRPASWNEPIQTAPLRITITELSKRAVLVTLIAPWWLTQ